MTDQEKRYLVDIKDNAIIWAILNKHLPSLKSEVEQLLNK